MKTRDRAIQKRTEPAFIEPMQCKPVTSLPAGEKWTFEIKFDGYRCIAVKRAREVTLVSRHQKVLNRRFFGVARRLLRSRASLFSTKDGCHGFTSAPFIIDHTKYCLSYIDILLRRFDTPKWRVACRLTGNSRR